MNPEAVDLSQYLITRNIVAKTKEQAEFSFLVIDRPEKWPEAESFKSQYHMPILGHDRRLTFDLHGVSLKDWEEVEEAHPLPEWNGDGDPTDEYKQQLNQATLEKQALIFEKATGVLVPGTTAAEKAAQINKFNPGETQALYLFIRNHACNYTDGSLLDRYSTFCARRESSAIENVKFTTYQDWEAATNAPYIYRMHRPCDEYIVEFPLKSPTAEQRLTIDQETREPEPPKKPKRDPQTRRLIQGQYEPDRDDEHWKKKVRAVNQKRLIMYLNTCLTFTVPGGNLMEQYDWVSRRLMGDVVKLSRFIEQDLCGYQTRYDFFTMP